MKMKKVLSMALALCMVFGSAAALPEGTFTQSTSITASAETSVNYFYTVLADGTIEITKCMEISIDPYELVIPSSLDGKTVSAIGENAFTSNYRMTKATIPDTVKTIGEGAFNACPNLTEIVIPNSVTSIGSFAFGNCSSLKSVTLPSSLKELGISAFSKCKSLENITIPGSVEKFDTQVFTECTKLASVTIENGVKTIGNGAFMDCTALKEVTIPDSVTNIEFLAFAYCTSLESITIPSSVTSIGKDAFYYSGLKSITIPGSVATIDRSTFANCANLETVVIEDGVQTLDSDAFSHCSSLKTVTIPKSVNKIYSAYIRNCVVLCYKDSAAETYAKKSNLEYELLDVEHVAAKAATCTVDGNIEYWKYDGKYYSDSKATKEMTQAQTVIKASHSFPSTCTVVKKPTIVSAGTESGKCTVCGDTVTRSYGTALTTDRVFGTNRFATSLEIAEKLANENNGKPFENIIIASGSDFADALSASYLAKVKNAPILITAGDAAGVINPVYDFINKNTAAKGNIYIVGGTSVVPESIVTTLKGKGYNVKRLAGNNRFLTNIEVLKEANVSSEDLLVASGLDYADALSASAVGKPILLVSGKSTAMTADQKAYIKTLNSKKAYIIGGTGAVSTGIETDLKALVSVERVNGKDRFDTSVAVADKFFKNPKAVAIAYGLNYPDGLCGGPLATAYGCPLLLTTNSSPAAAVAYAKNAGVKSAITFGGTTLVSDATVNKILGK